MHRTEVAILAAVLFSVLLIVTLVDLYVAQRGRRRTLHDRFVVWTHQYPIMLFFLSVMFGAALGHFFTKDPP